MSKVESVFNMGFKQKFLAAKEEMKKRDYARDRREEVRATIQSMINVVLEDAISEIKRIDSFREHSTEHRKLETAAKARAIKKLRKIRV